MGWFRQLDNHRGSRPRCVLLVDGSQEEVASRLMRLVDLPNVTVSPSDRWMPYGKPVREDGSWDTTPAREVELDKSNDLVCSEIQKQLQKWWLEVPGRGRGARTPNWDIASTCKIRGQPGLLLVEAKAHEKELKEQDKSGSSNPENREQIGRAIAEANREFRSVTGKQWCLSLDHHYQISNRFAWSWKLASLGIPVVLLYLGFLNAQDMANDDGLLFRSEAEWTRVLKDHSRCVVDETCWGEWLDIAGVPLIPLIRGMDQPLGPDGGEVGA